MRAFLKKNLFGLVTIIASASVLIWSICFGSNWRDTLNAARNIDISWFLAALACMVAYWILDSLVLHTFTRTKYKHFGMIRSMKISMTGFLYNALTPFATGGQPMQILDMSQEGVTAGEASSYITLKSMLYQLCMTLFAILAVVSTFRFFRGQVEHFFTLVSLGLVFNLIFIGIITLMCINRKLTMGSASYLIKLLVKIKLVKNPEALQQKIMEQIELFHQSASLLNRSRWAQVKAFVFTALQLILFYAIPYCIYKSFDLSGAALFYMLAAEAIINMITAFIPIPGASGAAEGSFYLFFAIFFSPITLLPAILLWRVITYYSCILLGGLIRVVDLMFKRRAMA